MVDEIYDELAAARMGIEEKGQVSQEKENERYVGMCIYGSYVDVVM